MIFAKKLSRNIKKCFLELLQIHLFIALIKICYNRHSDDFPTFSDTVLPKFLQLPYYKALTRQLLVIKLLLADYLALHTDFISIGYTMRCNTLEEGNSHILGYRMCHTLRVFYGWKINFCVYFVACNKLLAQVFSLE